MLALGPALDVNVFVDAILTAVFDHARAQRAQFQSPDVARSMVFSSYNARLCTALNWKQPNFPVFLCNDLGREENLNGTSKLSNSGRRSTSIKESVRIAQSNNFMGLMCYSRLLVCFLPPRCNDPCGSLTTNRRWCPLSSMQSSLTGWRWSWTSPTTRPTRAR